MMEWNSYEDHVDELRSEYELKDKKENTMHEMNNKKKKKIFL